MTRLGGYPKFMAIALVLLAAVQGRQALAETIYLSDYLGVPSGAATDVSNPPYTTVIAQVHGFGADIPGSFALNPIEFADAGPFTKGIGAHPLETGETRIEFDLDALRADGLDFDTFFAIVGIDQPSGGDQGAQFTIYLDGLQARRVSVATVSAPSIALQVDVGTASVLGLATNRLGTFFGNHAAWADARLERVNPVPLPGAALLFGGAVLSLGLRGRRGHRRPNR